MLALAGFELPGAIPTAVDEAALAAEGRALVGRIDRRLDELARRAAAEREGWPALDDTRRTELLAGRLGLLVGAATPLAPRFTAANAEALDATAARRRIGGGDEVTAWLDKAGRVDPGAERLRIAVDLCEAASAGTRFDFAVMQLPDHPEEGWAATSRPVADERGRLCIVATGAPAAFAGGPVAGLVLASWSESLARSEHPAGVAFHFDAAGTRAPQAVLLCVAPDGGFSVEAVRDMIGQTLDLARLRTVGPQALLDLGQYLPATYLPETLDAGGPAP
jgi:hypothetical protein